MGLILPRWDLILPRIPPSTPLLYSAVTHLFRGYVHTQSTPKPTQNTPFPGLNLKVGKMNYSLGNSNPNWAKCLKSGQNISRSGPKKFIHKLETHPVNAGHYMAFKHSISFATDLAAHFGCNWTQTWTLPPDQLVGKVLSASWPVDKLCWVWILFKTPKLRTAVSRYQPSSTRLFIIT